MLSSRCDSAVSPRTKDMEVQIGAYRVPAVCQATSVVGMYPPRLTPYLNSNPQAQIGAGELWLPVRFDLSIEVLREVLLGYLNESRQRVHAGKEELARLRAEYRAPGFQRCCGDHDAQVFAAQTAEQGRAIQNGRQHRAAVHLALSALRNKTLYQAWRPYAARNSRGTMRDYSYSYSWSFGHEIADLLRHGALSPFTAAAMGQRDGYPRAWNTGLDVIDVVVRKEIVFIQPELKFNLSVLLEWVPLGDKTLSQITGVELHQPVWRVPR